MYNLGRMPKYLPEAGPSQAKPGQARPSQAKPGQARPGQANQAKPGQAKPSQSSLWSCFLRQISGGAKPVMMLFCGKDQARMPALPPRPVPLPSPPPPQRL